MRYTLIQGAFLLVFCVTTPANAELLPSFMHQSLAANSDHVVLATEGEAIDGELVILAAYKGNLAVGSKINVPGLAIFAEPDRRKIHSFFGQTETKHEEVSGDLMILFLDGDKATGLRPSSAPEWFTWLCWIEDGLVYAKWQPVNPGDTILLPYGGGDGNALQNVITDIGAQEPAAKQAAADDPEAAVPEEGVIIEPGEEVLLKLADRSHFLDLPGARDVSKALEAAQAHAEEMSLDLSNRYIDSVRLHENKETSAQSWLVTWLPDRKGVHGGEIWMYVPITSGLRPNIEYGR